MAAQITWAPQNDGRPVTLHAPESAPFRYVFCALQSAVNGLVVQVHLGQDGSGPVVAVVPAGHWVGVPIAEAESVCALVPATAPAPAASDLVIFAASTAHLPAGAGAM